MSVIRVFQSRTGMLLLDGVSMYFQKYVFIFKIFKNPPFGYNAGTILLTEFDRQIFYYLYFIKITVLLMFYFNLEIKKYHIKVVIVNYLLTSQRILYKYTSLLALKKVISSTLFIYVLIIVKFCNQADLCNYGFQTNRELKTSNFH